MASRLVAFSLLATLCFGIIITDNFVSRRSRVGASSGKGSGKSNSGKSKKGHARRRLKVSRDLRAKKRSAELVKVIVQFNAEPSSNLKRLLKRSAFASRVFSALQRPVGEAAGQRGRGTGVLRRGGIRLCGSSVERHRHLTTTTGAAARARRRAGTTRPLAGRPGIGIAILDSGISTRHHSFDNRIVYSKDFTGENRTDDPYGHGTHVASMAAAGDHVNNGAYSGVARKANIINLRVPTPKVRARFRAFGRPRLGADSSSEPQHSRRNMSLGMAAMILH